MLAEPSTRKATSALAEHSVDKSKRTVLSISYFVRHNRYDQFLKCKHYKYYYIILSNQYEREILFLTI